MLEKLYRIISSNNSDGLIDCALSLDVENSIFKGHFPDFPVLPGVCMIQILKEILQDHLKQKILFVKGDSVKFLALIQPSSQMILNYRINYNIIEINQVIVSAEIISGDKIYFKFKGSYKIQGN